MEFVSDNAPVICKGRQRCIDCCRWRIVKSEKEKSTLKLSITELVITELVDVLSPFEASMSQVEGESKVTIGNVCAVVISLKKLMEEMILKLHICQILPRILLDQVNLMLNPHSIKKIFDL